MKKLFLLSMLTVALLCLSSCKTEPITETTSTTTITSTASGTQSAEAATEDVTTTASAAEATTSATTTIVTTSVTKPTFIHVDDVEPSFNNLIFEQHFMADWTFVEGFGYSERVEFSYNNDYSEWSLISTEPYEVQ